MTGHAMIAGPHFWTAIAYYIIGIPLIVLALKVWWMHPINRAIYFGDYVTERGLARLLRNWPFTFLFGAFILSCGIEHHLDYLASRGRVNPEFVRFVANIEAIISLWTAASMIYVFALFLTRISHRGK